MGADEEVDHGDFDRRLAADELSIGVLRLAFKADAERWEASRSTRRLIARTKEFLETTFADPIRLADIAQAVGASPAYLTDVFSRVEGIPLHRYLTQLRLARALVELPDARDITTVALNLGFSSHSHFTASFRRAFGCTPSQFRKFNGKRALLVIRSSEPAQQDLPGHDDQAVASDTETRATVCTSKST